MTIITTPPNGAPVSYPCLLVSDEHDVMVMATSPSNGFVLRNDPSITCWPLGHHIVDGESWSDAGWELFHGTITLSNHHIQ